MARAWGKSKDSPLLPPPSSPIKATPFSSPWYVSVPKNTALRKEKKKKKRKQVHSESNMGWKFPSSLLCPLAHSLSLCGSQGADSSADDLSAPFNCIYGAPAVCRVASGARKGPTTMVVGGAALSRWALVLAWERYSSRVAMQAPGESSARRGCQAAI